LINLFCIFILMNNQSSTSNAVRSLREEQRQAISVHQKIKRMGLKISDIEIQLEGFRLALAQHETTMKREETQIKFLNKNLSEKELKIRELNSLRPGMLNKVEDLQKKVSVDEENLKTILKAQTDAFLALEHVKDYKEELELKQEEQQKLMREAPDQVGSGFIEKYKQQRKTSVQQGEVKKCNNRIISKQREVDEAGAKLVRIKQTRMELDAAVQTSLSLIANTEKHALQNESILKTHRAEVEKISSALMKAKMRYKIANDKVVSIQEQISETLKDCANYRSSLEQLENTLAEVQNNVARRQKSLDDMCVTLSITEE